MYHAIDAAVIRSSFLPLAEPVAPWPDLEGDSTADIDRWRAWMTRVWADETKAAAIEFAAPLLADAIRKVLAGAEQRPRVVRRAVVSLARYLLRMRHRATPFGLFAGPAPLRVGPDARVHWGTKHRVFARAAAEWLNDVITALEGDWEIGRAHV